VALLGPQRHYPRDEQDPRSDLRATLSTWPCSSAPQKPARMGTGSDRTASSSDGPPAPAPPVSPATAPTDAANATK